MWNDSEGLSSSPVLLLAVLFVPHVRGCESWRWYWRRVGGPSWRPIRALPHPVRHHLLLLCHCHPAGHHSGYAIFLLLHFAVCVQRVKMALLFFFSTTYPSLVVWSYPPDRCVSKISHTDYCDHTPSGLIIDAFGELRDQQEQVKEDMEVRLGATILFFSSSYKLMQKCTGLLTVEPSRLSGYCGSFGRMWGLVQLGFRLNSSFKTTWKRDSCTVCFWCKSAFPRFQIILEAGL